MKKKNAKQVQEAINTVLPKKKIKEAIAATITPGTTVKITGGEHAGSTGYYSKPHPDADKGWIRFGGGPLLAVPLRDMSEV